MSTISVPLNSKLESALDNLIKSGFRENKAAIMREALNRLSEEEAFLSLLKSEQEIKNGLILRGDLREIAKRMK